MVSEIFCADIMHGMKIDNAISNAFGNANTFDWKKMMAEFLILRLLGDNQFCFDILNVVYVNNINSATEVLYINTLPFAIIFLI